MNRNDRTPYHRSTEPFLIDGEAYLVEAADDRQTVQRRRSSTREVEESLVVPKGRAGTYIHALVASGAGAWIASQRISGQGEWGYDVFRSRPLVREAGVSEERGCMLDPPRFSPDETVLIGAAGEKFLGGWWAHPDDEIDEPSRGGRHVLGFLFVHRLPSHDVVRHELAVDLPAGWTPDDPWAEWYGPRNVGPTEGGVELTLSWAGKMELRSPLPEWIRLPTPHPSGRGVLHPAETD